MVNTGLLILTNPNKVGRLFPILKSYFLKTLYVQYIPEKNVTLDQLFLERKISKQFRIVENIYILAASHLNTVDIRIIITNMKKSNEQIVTKKPIDLVIFDKALNTNDAKIFMNKYIINTSKSCDYITESNDKKEDDDADYKDVNINEKVYKNVVLGGTFDRLHNGHKILLSRAVLHCSEKLTVGVTDKNMNYKKTLWELMESCEKRINSVEEFLKDIDSTINYEIVLINDMYGPTKHDPTFELIVTSEETLKGAEKINKYRSENGLNTMDIEVVKLASDSNHCKHEEFKISSSNSRIRLLGTRLKQPDNVGKDLKPYIIGLTGGIASGKSSVAEKLQSLGAKVIYCDKLAHELYKPGRKCYDLVIEAFGKEIILPSGEINRKILGNIVFNDKQKLEQLNQIVWPGLLEETLNQIQCLKNEGAEIIVVEAAVLIQAKWQFMCHEIWACIIPHDEAVKRIMERNNLNKEQAESRINVQPNNINQIDEATVVFCTLWSHEFTFQQIQKAWYLLNQFLSKDNQSVKL